MAKQQRNFYLSDKDMEILEQFKEENGFSSNSNAVSYLIRHSKDKEEEKIAKAVSEELDKHYYSKERLRWSTQTAEQNSIVMLDAINTLLFMFDAETLIPADNAPHKVITQSKHMMKEKIAHFKQMSDDRKRRKAEKMNSK